MIYIIIPTFGRAGQTAEFLNSVKSKLPNVQFVITDDHPDLPNSMRFAADPSCMVLCSRDPLWWVGSINLGLTYLMGIGLKDDDIVIFANNDVVLPESADYLQIISDLKRNPRQIFVPVTEDTNGQFVSSGCQLNSVFPYFTNHPRFPQVDTEIDFATARFLMTSGYVIKEVGLVNPQLLQYHGDYYFSKKAKKLGIKTYITPRVRCIVDDNDTGLKNFNIRTFSEFYESLFSERSPNNIEYRFKFFRSFYSPVVSVLIVAQITTISFVRYLGNALRGLLDG